MINSYISMKQIWADYDTTVEMEICVSLANTFCKGSAKFINTIYTDVEQITQMLEKLSDFYDQVSPSLEIELGGLGSKRANGFIRIRLNKTSKGLVCVSVFQQSDFGPSGNLTVANEAKMHMACEPCSIDNFVKDYRSSRAPNMCNEVLPFDASEDYVVSPNNDLTEEVIWKCSEQFQIVELQHDFLGIP